MNHFRELKGDDTVALPTTKEANFVENKTKKWKGCLI